MPPNNNIAAKVANTKKPAAKKKAVKNTAQDNSGAVWGFRPDAQLKADINQFLIDDNRVRANGIETLIKMGLKAFNQTAKK
jgi:hypothetical protein